MATKLLPTAGPFPHPREGLVEKEGQGRPLGWGRVRVTWKGPRTKEAPTDGQWARGGPCVPTATPEVLPAWPRGCRRPSPKARAAQAGPGSGASRRQDAPCSLCRDTGSRTAGGEGRAQHAGGGKGSYEYPVRQREFDPPGKTVQLERAPRLRVGGEKWRSRSAQSRAHGL